MNTNKFTKIIISKLNLHIKTILSLLCIIQFYYLSLLKFLISLLSTFTIDKVSNILKV